MEQPVLPRLAIFQHKNRSFKDPANYYHDENDNSWQGFPKHYIRAHRLRILVGYKQLV